MRPHLRRIRPRLPVLLAALAVSFACARQAQVETEPRGPSPLPYPTDRAAVAPAYPGAEWDRVSAPEAAGYSSEALDALHEYVDSINTSAVMAVVGGYVLFEHGPVDSLSYLASVRKSILAMMYGNYVEEGTIDLELTLEDMGMDDVDGLLPIERRARVVDLISARSGIYHPASNPGDNSADAPPRGSQEPGTYFLYNNWDFNAAGAVFERLTERNIYDALETDLAVPLGFQDWNRSIHRKTGDESRSRNLAYHMVLSTRDMARIGYLMLREGVWDGERVIPRDWARRISSVITPLEEMNPERIREQMMGYGYMWWVWDPPDPPAGTEVGPNSIRWALQGAYSGRGAYGQYITVLPRLDMVIAHKTVPRAETGWGDYMGIVGRLINARCAASGC